MRSESVCPDCGRPIYCQPSGWWTHDGLPNGCWRLSMDGPNDAPDDDCGVQDDPPESWAEVMRP